MKRILVFILSGVCIAVVCITSCVHKPQLAVTPADSGYPAAVEKIIINKCTLFRLP